MKNTGCQLVYLSGWDRESLFIDPIAIRTIAIEAAMISANIPPQFCRKIALLFTKMEEF